MAGANDDKDRFFFGAALVIALVAGGIAVASNLSEEELPPAAAAPDPVQAARERAATEERRTRIEFEPIEDQEARRTPPGFVLDLPEVPDLATQPPPARPASNDPRMESLAAEMRILSHAREMLGEHPAEALGVIRQHQRQYPDGVLREEREAFAIEVLLALEHTDEAERRYYDFLQRFPQSEHRESLQRAMLRPPHRIGAGGR